MALINLLCLNNLYRIDVNFVIKVADFGLSENIGTKDYFRQAQDIQIKLPLKWLAPESMDDHIFSEKSDVVSMSYSLRSQKLIIKPCHTRLFQWAYGVTCWEIFSGGKVPYPSVNVIDLPRELVNGYRLQQPSNSACNNEM